MKCIWLVATNARTLSTTRNCEKQGGESAASIAKTSGIGTQPIAQRTALTGNRERGSQMKGKKPERITIAEFNDQMMDDAYAMLAEALKEAKRVSEKLDNAITTIIKARIDE